ncbi:FAD-dependent oxidoreductase [Candidatus Fermentibacteria bacterium]|nr:FAD-dependent oxidoreductase [Candidatus Fermentibacteria bacterium]
MFDLLSPHVAHREAWRCLVCWDAPCTAACPVHVPIPEFIARLRSNDVVGAEELVREANPLISTCGEICPDEQYCSRACVLRDAEGPIRVRELHRFVTASAHAPWPAWAPSRPERLAVVGAGPAGIACARELAALGWGVDVYERDAAAGGVVRHALAVGRFAVERLDSDLDALRGAPITWHMGHAVPSLREILESYAAVFYAPGTHRDVLLDLQGEDTLMVSGMEFLRGWRMGQGLDLTGKEVVVVGGGNASLDVALTACHAGAARVVLVYRRGPREMPVWRRELEQASSKGISVEYYAHPVGIIAEAGVVRGLQCRRTRLVDHGGRRPVPEDMEGFDFILPADVLLRAVGSEPERDEDVDVRWGSKATVPVTEAMETSRRGLFAGGDLVSREGTVVAAASHGLRAARAIHRMLGGRS